MIGQQQRTFNPFYEGAKAFIFFFFFFGYRLTSNILFLCHILPNTQKVIGDMAPKLELIQLQITKFCITGCLSWALAKFNFKYTLPKYYNQHIVDIIWFRYRQRRHLSNFMFLKSTSSVRVELNVGRYKQQVQIVSLVLNKVENNVHILFIQWYLIKRKLHPASYKG